MDIRGSQSSSGLGAYCQHFLAWHLKTAINRITCYLFTTTVSEFES